MIPVLQHALAEQGWREPTAIQVQALAAALRGQDVWATAPTGSGKTLAFVLPLLQQQLLWPRRGSGPRLLRSLVVVPTRELAVQVGALISSLAMPLGLRVAVLHGGVSINPQLMGLRGGADLVVATPGRLLDVHAHRALALQHVQHLVLDEADRLLDGGFIEELQRVVALLPAKRQTLLFSATFAAAVQDGAKRLLQAPSRVTLETEPMASDAKIEQRAFAVDEGQRGPLLRHLLREQLGSPVLVFVATRHACEHVANKLYAAGFFATAWHGNMSQGARQSVLNELKAGRWDVVVTTDLAARGIDIVELPVVVNYDLPRSATDYIHRIGRTGRAGATGLAVSFVTPAQSAHWRLINKRHGLQVPAQVVAGFEPLSTPPPPSPLDPEGRGGIKGKRPSKKDKLRAAAARASSMSKSGA